MGYKIMCPWLIYLHWRREVFVNYHRTTGHIGQYFTLSAKFWLQELHSSEQFLEGRKEPWNFGSKGWKFYIITFLTFLSQHFDQERVSFSKVNTGAHANWIYDHRVYLQNLLRVAMRLWCSTFLFAGLFLPYFISHYLCFNIRCVKSFDWWNNASK